MFVIIFENIFYEEMKPTNQGIKIKEIEAKTIITKSGLPGTDLVINPYVGCSHGCRYCYARFMKKFTGHTEPWGDFVDVKINAPDLIKKQASLVKYQTLVIGSVTDPYLFLEKKYEITRKILQVLVEQQPYLEILTKSDLVLRDVDLLKKFRHCRVAISVSFLEERIKNKLEPRAPSTKTRLETLQELHEQGIKTILFISPIFPVFTDWKELINLTQGFVTEYWFEDFNYYPSLRPTVGKILKEEKVDMPSDYDWDSVRQEIKDYCAQRNLQYKIYFHH